MPPLNFENFTLRNPDLVKNKTNITVPIEKSLFIIMKDILVL